MQLTKVLFVLSTSVWCFASQPVNDVGQQTVSYRDLLSQIQAGNASTLLGNKDAVPWVYKSRPSQFEHKLAQGMHSIAHNCNLEF